MGILRRDFLAGAAGVLAAKGATKSHPTVIVRSGWQTINIGDIAHTPGLLALLERHLPDAQLVLWPAAVDRGTEPMLLRRFPKLRILSSDLQPDGIPANPDLRAALASADLFIHGSAASASSQAQVAAWKKSTTKPYGFFGVGFTVQGEAAGAALSDNLRKILAESAFVFTRETASLANVKRLGLQGPETAFAPDGTFSMDILDEARADAFLKENGLTPGEFICVIPRLRYTPYHKIRKVDWSPEEIRRREEVNDRNGEKDQAKLREAAIAYVRKIGGKVLFCPEMTYEIDIIDPLLYDPLPEDVKPKIVRRKSFWLPDEAASVYKRAVAVISSECHSPILAAVQGTPCMYIHQPEDGIKGQMWKDIGLGDWYFEIEDASGEAIAQRVLQIAGSREASRRKVRGAVAFAQKTQAERAKFIREKVLGRDSQRQ